MSFKNNLTNNTKDFIEPEVHINLLITNYPDWFIFDIY